FDLKKFPYLTAELGGGLQVTAHRRTIALAEDIAAVALTKLGSGCNLLGYYMYSGGTNPEGKLTTLQESTATGYLNNLPVKSYDFRAPIREFGQVSDTLRELKLLSYFVREWGEGFCSLDCEIPSEIKPDDLNSLRLAYRTDGKRGYAFINNYVRHQKMAEHKDVEIKSPDKNTVFPMINVGDGDYFFLPFNMNYGKTLVKTATVTPLTKISGVDGDVFVFYRRKNDSSDKGFFDFSERHGEKFLVLSRSDALNSWRDESGRLIITGSDSCAVENEKGEIEIHTRSDGKIFVFPDFDKVPSGWKKTGLVNKNTACDLDEILFAEYEPLSASEQRKEEKISFEKIREENGCAYYSLDFSSLSDNAFVRLSYTGDSANLYEIKNGERKLLLDHFYLGEDYPWEIGLKRFADGKADLKNLELEILPLKKGAKLYLEKWPEFSGDESAALHSVSCETERRFRI
ncbi:MAG: beta-galactosidase, partial [Treponema sp.]|nr:beta-galactosidase [Treponema sp.]